MSNYKIGIITPTLNRIDKTKRFINYLSEQSYSNYTLYLCDSGSTDGTDTLANDDNIQLVECSNEDWWTEATNRGVRKAITDQCELILTINDDCVITSTYLESLVNCLFRNNLDILGSRVDFSDEPGKIWSLGAYNTWGTRDLFQLKYHNLWEDNLPISIKDSEIIETQTLCGNGVLIKKEVFDQIGLYNTRFCPHYHGDSEFVLRAKKKKLKIAASTEITVYNDVSNHALGTINAKKISLLRSLKNNFFSNKSNLHLKPSLYIILKYCPTLKIPSTITKYFSHWIIVLYSQSFKQSILNNKIIYNSYTKGFVNSSYSTIKNFWNRINVSL